MTTDGDEQPPRVPIVCAECDTTTQVPLPDVADTLSRHNDQLHDGAEVAEVDPDLRDRLADVVAEDLRLLED